MAGRLPIFGDSIFQPQQVASAAPGERAINSAVQSGLSVVQDVAENVEKEKSTAMLYQQTGLASQAKSEYNASLISQPQNAKPSYDIYKTKLNALYSSASLNSGDKSTLLNQVNTDSNEAFGKMLNTQAHQQKLGAVISFNDNFPGTLDEISSNLMANHDLAEKQIKTVQSNLDNGVYSGVISPNEYKNYGKMLSGVIDRHTQLMSRIGTLDAQGLHTSAAFTAHAGSPNAPISQNTQTMQSHFDDQSNFHDVIAHAQQNNLTNSDAMFAVSKLSENQWGQFLNTIDGISKAQGAINSAQPYGAIQARYNALNSSKASGLTS